MQLSTLFTIAAAAGTVAAAPHTLQKRCSGGQATFFAVGLGNCGWYNQPSDYIVALPTSTYAGGSLCGQQVTITNQNNGRTATATIADSCPSCNSACDLDMSTSLFADLAGSGWENQGVFPISWSMGGGGGNQQAASSSSNNNNNNNNQQQQQQQQQTTSSSSQKQQPTSTQQQPTQQQTSSSSPAPQKSSAPSPAAAASTPTPTPVAPENLKNVSSIAPTGKPNTTVATEPAWWAQIDPTYCGFNQPAENVTVAAVGPTQQLNNTVLNQACGQWILIENPENKKNVTALVTSWLPGTPEGFLVLTDGYKKIATMQGDQPNPISNVTWGYIPVNATAVNATAVNATKAN